MSDVAGGAGMTGEVGGAGGTDATTPFDRAERRIWSGRAEACARTYVRLCAHPVEALLDAAGAGSGTRVFDVGCGSGTVSTAAAARGADVYAADAESGMVTIGRVPAAPGQTLAAARGAYEGICAESVRREAVAPPGHRAAGMGEGVGRRRPQT